MSDFVDKARAWDAAQTSWKKGAEAAEARCARLEKALQQIIDAQPPSEAVSMDDWEVYHQLSNERAVIAHAALSDTAQQEAGDA